MDDRSSDAYLGSVTGTRKVLRFALPSVVMMVFISSYNVVDGAFISNYVDTDALASLNIMMPVFSLVTGVGFMFATGGSAYVSNLFGKGEPDMARAAFTQIIIAVTAVSVVFTLFGSVFVEDIASLSGADEALLDGCVEYTRVYLFFTVFLILQFVTNQFLVVAGRPSVALYSSIAGGISNIVLDYVFIAVLGWGLEGAAAASGIGSLVPSCVALALFADRRMYVRFAKPARGAAAIASSLSNGVSEMVSEVSGGVTVLCYNLVMMRYIGADGVAAISILSYVEFLALSVVIGYSNGVAPLMSFRHGAGDRSGIRNLFRTSMLFVSVLSVSVFAMMELFAGSVAGLFAQSSDSVMDLVEHGATVYAFGFLFMGINVYASSMFTSLSNGKVSAWISFVRTLLLLAPLIILFPAAFGIDSVWFAVPVTEAVTVTMV
ncbi:MAG: polysaccharide biosynthesis C-terminal domain-containing protein, partial [Candidatus Methanomethylophilaceae archaeon]|nr:polysaccharide biosynthesis C-terminal domain-containing protein [Candidatus Methanomethylophilaceae archaeon]